MHSVCFPVLVTEGTLADTCGPGKHCDIYIGLAIGAGRVSSFYFSCPMVRAQAELKENSMCSSSMGAVVGHIHMRRRIQFMEHLFCAKCFIILTRTKTADLLGRYPTQRDYKGRALLAIQWQSQGLNPGQNSFSTAGSSSQSPDCEYLLRGVFTSNL